MTNSSLIASVPAAPGAAFSVAKNPATGESLEPNFYHANAELVDDAANQAEAAFDTLKSTSGAERARFLRTIADNIIAAGDEIAKRATAETGLPEPRIRMETGRTVNQLRLFADLVEEGSWVDARIDRGNPNREPIPKPDTRSMLRPLGPVAVFCASNFPLAFSVAGGDTASAFAAGCPVIAKAHSGHLGTAAIVGETIAAAVKSCGLPRGAFSLLFGSGRVIGKSLVGHPSIKAVGFTGSRRGGTDLMKVAAARPEPIPVYAEMSSINPVVILPGILDEGAEAIAAGLHGSVTLGVGQFCTNPGLILAPPHSAFRDKLAALFGETPPACMLHTGIKDAYTSGVASRENSFAKPLYDGHSDQSDTAALAAPALFEIDAIGFLADPSLQDEVFGPSTLIVTYDTDDELRCIVAALEGQLTATIHGTASDLAQNRSLVDLLESKAGRLLFGGFPTGVEVCHSMVHGGPFPATSDGRSTSVGTSAIFRFTRPVCYQSFPDDALPQELQEANPVNISRIEDGKRI